MRTSPDIGNYFQGLGRLYLKLEGANDFRHMGNCSNFEFAAAIEKLEHNAHMFGELLKDFSRVKSKASTLSITLDEFTPENLALAMLGTREEISGAGSNEIIEILGASELVGHVRLVGTNNVGPRFQADLFRVSFEPGSIPLISEDLATMELSAECLALNGRFGTLLDITDETIESASV